MKNNNDGSGNYWFMDPYIIDPFIDDDEWTDEEFYEWPWCHCPGVNELREFILLMQIDGQQKQLFVPLTTSKRRH